MNFTCDKVRNMNLLTVGVKLKYFCVLIIVFLSENASAWNQEYTVHNSRSKSSLKADVVLLDHTRLRRDLIPMSNTTANVTTAVPSNTTVLHTNATAKINDSNDSSTAPIPTVAVTQLPLLGVNGSGILKINITENTPKVSDPIDPDDNFKDIFNETPERISAQHNLTNATIDSHDFYNSTFIGNVTYFDEYWKNISMPGAEVHEILSNSHRRATFVQLKFAFPFYGHYIHNITVATGGFIYTGEHVHNWLAATQYIAPLMANFDTTLTNDSYVKLYDDGEKFTVFWENVNLQDEANQTFTFAVTLYKNGDIVFAYKHIPIEVQDINDTQHPVKVGISDAYLTDNIIFYVRRKTIYEYHRVSFRNHRIANSTILKLVALPTCLQYNTCESCLNHDTGFNCTWCPQIQKCSSGTDRNKQDWKLRNCEKTTIRNVATCTAGREPAPGNRTAYSTDTPQPPNHNTTVDNIKEHDAESPVKNGTAGTVSKVISQQGAEVHRTAVGSVIVAFLAITLVCGAAAWALYAFKNPHTRSGQILIKYRPSQWRWRCGEARYTAATIHM